LEKFTCVYPLKLHLSPMPTASNTAAAPLKLSEMGTSGLLQWISAGEDRLTDSTRPGIRAAKTARASAIIQARYGSEAAVVFRKVARREAQAREAVRRLRQPGAAILCQATIGEAYHSGRSIADLCRMAGRPHHYADAIDQAREDIANPDLSDHARRTAAEFLAAI